MRTMISRFVVAEPDDRTKRPRPRMTRPPPASRGYGTDVAREKARSIAGVVAQSDRRRTDRGRLDRPVGLKPRAPGVAAMPGYVQDFDGAEEVPIGRRIPHPVAADSPLSRP